MELALMVNVDEAGYVQGGEKGSKLYTPISSLCSILIYIQPQARWYLAIKIAKKLLSRVKSNKP